MLNPNLDVTALARAYAATRRIRIDDALVPEAAEGIHRCLQRETPWSLVYLEGRNVVRMTPEELKALSPQDRARFAGTVLRQAATEYQFLYNAYLILENYLARKNPDHLLHRIFEYINSDPMLDLVRAVTGESSIVKADGQATLYAPGHFLKEHDDEEAEKGRRVAYVMGFTKNWHPDWGGQLQFFDARKNVTDAFVPHFNSLMLFTVPQDHCVTYVPPFAPIGRYAITGWFRDR